MKPLTANLKTLYQCRFMWLFHIVLISGVLIMTAVIFKLDTADPPYIAIPLLLFFIYGVTIAFLVADVLSKPFAFCLPDQIKTAQKMFFLIWLSITVLTTILVAALSFFGIKSDYTQLFSSIGLMSLSYWLGAIIIVPKRGLIEFPVFFLIIFPEEPYIFQRKRLLFKRIGI